MKNKKLYTLFLVICNSFLDAKTFVMNDECEPHLRLLELAFGRRSGMLKIYSCFPTSEGIVTALSKQIRSKINATGASRKRG